MQSYYRRWQEMRTRKEIMEDHQQNTAFLHREELNFEVLLDIRELLQDLLDEK